MIEKNTLDFLAKLKKNNNREWFTDNKDKFVTANDNCKEFAQALWEEVNTHDELEEVPPRKVVHRIYRDVRFSKDKTPYKTNLWGSFQRATIARRGGYYWSVNPNGLTIGAGFWGPEPADLLRIRKEFEADADPMRKILTSKKFRETWGEMLGESVKTAPKGFQKDDPAIDLIKRKGFYFMKDFSKAEVTSDDIVKKASAAFMVMRPYYDYMTEVLTTDLDGRSLI